MGYAPPLMTPVVTGNITTQNSVPAGTATAGSAVELTLGGCSTIAIQTTGTFTGALTLQATLNGTTWVTIGGSNVFFNLNNGGNFGTITSALQSIFHCEAAGFLKVRITALAAVTGTATVTIAGVPGSNLVKLDGNLPTGTNTIGTVATTMAASTTASPAKAEDVAHVSGDVGVQILGVRIDAAVVQTSASGDYASVRLNQFNDQTVVPGALVPAAPVNVGTSTTVATLLSANTSRKGFIISNKSSSILYVKYGTGATNADFSIAIPAGQTYESSFIVGLTAITGLLETGTGAALVTEFT